MASIWLNISVILIYSALPVSTFVQALQKRHVVYNHSLEVLKEMERAGQAFVIQPDKKLDISRMENDIEVIQQVYDLGGKDARIRMKALKDWMKQ